VDWTQIFFQIFGQSVLILCNECSSCSFTTPPDTKKHYKYVIVHMYWIAKDGIARQLTDTHHSLTKIRMHALHLWWSYNKSYAKNINTFICTHKYRRLHSKLSC